jgi:hypothetical protein
MLRASLVWTATFYSNTYCSTYCGYLKNRDRPRFFDQVGQVGRRHISKISIFSLNHVIVRPTKIMNNLLKDRKICTFKVISQHQNFLMYILCFLKICPIFSTLFTILVGLTMTWFNEKLPNLIKKFWTVSTKEEEKSNLTHPGPNCPDCPTSSLDCLLDDGCW